MEPQSGAGRGDEGEEEECGDGTVTEGWDSDWGEYCSTAFGFYGNATRTSVALSDPASTARRLLDASVAPPVLALDGLRRLRARRRRNRGARTRSPVLWAVGCGREVAGL